MGECVMTVYLRFERGDIRGKRAFSGQVAPGRFRVIDLNDIMVLDHVVRVHPDGWITDDGPGSEGYRHAPELWEGKLDDAAWSLVGTSGQEGGGSVMHNSEFVGGRLADLMLAAPGLYVAVACYWECGDDCEDDECNESHMEGWGLAHLPDGEVTS